MREFFLKNYLDSFLSYKINGWEVVFFVRFGAYTELGLSINKNRNK